MKHLHHYLLSALACLGLVSMTSCTNTQKGATTGGLGGAAVGALIADDPGKGALIGGAIGAAGGAAVGSAKDKRERNYYYY